MDEPLEIQVLMIGNSQIFRPLLLTGGDSLIPQQLQIIVEYRQRSL